MKNKIKYIVILAIVLIISLFTLIFAQTILKPLDINESDNNEDTSYTLMIYMNGSDLESTSGYASVSLAQIINKSKGGNVNIVVQTGGTSKWQKPEIDSTTNQIHLIKDGTFTTVKTDLEPKSMAESSTLSDFIKYSTENYPAQKYSLLFWGHGFGAINGFAYDQLFDNDTMTLPEMKIAIKEANTKYEFVGFDTCLMGTLETAWIFKDYANYFLGSEDSTLASSWGYMDWIEKLNANPSMPTEKLGKIIVDEYMKKYMLSNPMLALIDLTKLDDVNNQLTKLSTELIDVIENWDFKVVLNSRISTTAFNNTSVIGGPTDMVDIVALSRSFNEYALEETKDMINTVQKAVIYPKPPKDDIINGLSIYFPLKNIQNIEEKMITYKEIGFNDEYIKFLDLYIERLQSMGNIIF